MAVSNNIVATVKAFLQAFKTFLNGSTNNVPNETPIQVSLYTSAQNRNVSGEPVKETYPCVAIDGPTIEENKALRMLAVEDYNRVTDPQNPAYLTYMERKYPRYYNLIFRITPKSNNPMELLSLQERVNAFFQNTPQANGYQLGVTAAVGSLEKVTMTDVREASGEAIIRNVKVYADEIGVQGDMVGTIELYFGDGETNQLFQNPTEVTGG